VSRALVWGMESSALYFIPLGGSGEIGMNLNVYAWQGKLLVIDCGITFERRPGGATEIHMPDPTWLARRSDQIAGLVLTHAHEDHIGAVTAMWPQLRCPVYATPFTATILRAKLAAARLVMGVPLREVRPGGATSVGPFGIRFIGITHSTAECQSVVIETDHGRVLHTGDWKLDPAPMVGPKTDAAAFRALGSSGGVLAAVSDSTNATRPGRSGSEGDVRKHLMERCGGVKGRLVVSCFASNIARIATLLEVAAAHDRHPVLMGRSLHRMVGAARASGYLDSSYSFVPVEHSGFLPRDRVMLICTGTQGEPRAAMGRLSTDSFRHMMLDPGDTAVFSSKIIPGNEQPIALLHRRLSEQGVAVVSEAEEPEVHVSGHPCRDELADFYDWVKPRCVVPVHGTPRHLEAHAELARQLGIDDVQVRNGDVLQLAPGEPRVIDRVRAGRIPRPDVEKDEHFRRSRGNRRRNG
jgi:ribonuclease J